MANLALLVDASPAISADHPRVGEILQNALTALVTATRASNALPKTSLELDLYRSFPSYLGFCHEQAAGLQSRLAHLIRQVGSLPPPPGADVDDQLENIVEANDGIMEKVSLILDRLSGLRQSELPVLPTGLEPPKTFVSSWNRGRKGEADSSTIRLLTVGRLPRPQLSFPTPPDNSNRRFLPKLQLKPNALSPLPSELLVWQKKEEKRKMKDEEEPPPELFAHPYKYEIEQLEMPAHLLEAPTQEPPDPMEDGACEIVQDPEKLQAVLDDLMKYKEIAVDLEHHSYRSYLGFTCLIQLSTSDKDYILDALVLRGHLHLLNRVFTHPGILKVFHGASMDVIWLQRDFGVYVVSMWDTAEGSRLLTGRRAGLRHLLLQYCDVSADKRYQLADWRIRPLPDEMVRYARQDTHYLLYIALRQRQDLLDRGGVSFIRQAWSLSKAVALKHYEKPLYSEEAFEVFLHSRERGITSNLRNVTAMRLLHAWRDNIARVEDESSGYVLPNHMLLKISHELPKTVQGVLACCVPPPPLLCRHLADVHTLVLQAWNSPEDSAQQGANGKPEHLEKPAKENVVYCTELCDEPTTYSLLANEKALESVQIAQPVITLFEESHPQGGKEAKRKQRALEIQQSFSNPFMLFLPSEAAKVLVPCPGGLVDQTTQSFASASVLYR
uniref:exosome complex component 10 isoform X2 n=1 Tax=Myxine glutinosa TaxID=7769 RepID=UPI00358FFE1D